MVIYIVPLWKSYHSGSFVVMSFDVLRKTKLGPEKVLLKVVIALSSSYKLVLGFTWICNLLGYAM